MKHLIYVGENDYYTQYKYKQYNDFSDIVLIYIFLLYVASMYMCFKAMIRLYVYRYTIKDSFKDSPQKEVIIVRGVPGIGKDTFVYTQEQEYSKGTFSIVSADQFFTNNRKYSFSRMDISKADSSCFEKFHLNLSIGVPRVYVTNVNNRKWMYSHYIMLARVYNYKVKIVELVCNDYDELYFFNKRSSHHVPLTYSRNVFNKWDTDETAEYVQPYYGDLAGDSLPYPRKTKKELDRELDRYMRGAECKVETDSDDEVDVDLNDMECIEYISMDTISKIERRRLYTIRFNIKNKKMIYLKLDLEVDFISMNE